jgi:plasmid stabilization system protein ParE
LRPVRWQESAAVEAENAAAYYDEHAEGGGARFGEQLWAAVELVREYPEAGAPYGLPFRRVVFRSYPYSVVYRPDHDAILIIAVKHDRMMPVAWEDLVSGPDAAE